MITVLISDGKGAREKIIIHKDELLIGREPDNDVALSSPEVSRQHAKITQHDGNYHLRDLCSTNGTFVGEDRIQSEVILKTGESFFIGGYELTLEEEEKVKSTPELKKEVQEKLLKKMDLKKLNISQMQEQDLREKVRKEVEDIISETDMKFQSIRREEFVKEILDESLGLGPLEDLILNPEITEIMVNGKDKIYIEREGKLTPYHKKFASDEQVLAVIQRIVAPLGRRIDESTPLVDARLKDGSRVNAIIPPLSIGGPTLTIRKFSPSILTIHELIKLHSLNSKIADFLKICVLARRNILISGGTGTGKTTLLNIISDFIPDPERIITIEDSAELKLSQQHVVSLEARPPNIEGRGQITIRDLVRNALRMRPDRIIVGECRGAEALDMLQAMNTGHDGSITTIHANSCRDSLSRLETMVLMAGMDLPVKAIRDQISSAIQIILQLSRMPGGERKIVRIAEISGMKEGTISLEDIFIFEKKAGSGGEFKASGVIPHFIKELIEQGQEIDTMIFRDHQ